MARTLQFRDVFITTAAKYSVTYVDLYEDPSVDVFVLEPERYMALDGLHPSADGYGIWYAKLRPGLLSLLTTQNTDSN